MELPAELTRLKHRLEQYREGAVLPWLNFPSSDARADPSHFGEVGEYDGVYTPWLTDEQERAYYPSNYSGPGWPTGTKPPQ